jgi:hypothetical protein
VDVRAEARTHPVGCFTRARNYLQVSTEIFILTGGYPSRSDPGCPGLPALDCPVFMVRHSRLMICKVEGIYFEAVLRGVCLGSAGARLPMDNPEATDEQ